MMRFRTFTVGCECDCEALNGFLAAHRIVRTEHRYEDGRWRFLVEYDERSGEPPGRALRGPKIDYREVLSADEFAVFAKLRDVRKRLAEDEGVAVFAVATNEQLAQFVRDKAHDLAGLKAVSGFGESRTEKYGAAFLKVLAEGAGNGTTEI